GGVERLSSAQHEGTGPHKRQEKPHVNFAVETPEGKYIVVCDLDTDELVTYQIEYNELMRVHTLNVKPGSGPRHIVFHPNRKTSYLLTQISHKVIVLDYDREQ